MTATLIAFHLVIDAEMNDWLLQMLHAGVNAARTA
jgi:hypothetical protein